MSKNVSAGAALGLIVGALVYIFFWPLILAWAWNLSSPLFWAKAPHLGYWSAFAANIVIGTIAGAFRKK